MQVSNTPFPTHLNFADVRHFLASLLSAETPSTERTWYDVEAGEPPRPAKRLRTNGTAPATEPGQIIGEETAIPDQLASLQSSIEAWMAWYQSLRMQYPTVIPNLSFARRRLKDTPGKLSRQKDRVQVAQREYDATLADLEIARSQFLDLSRTPNANPVSGQPAYGKSASYAIELREAEDAFAAARMELEKQRSSRDGDAKIAHCSRTGRRGRAAEEGNPRQSAQAPRASESAVATGDGYGRLSLF
jgi:hypothetical protein